MPKKKVLNLQWPVGGLHRANGYQAQPPYTTFDCSNVRVRDSILGRSRGGSRPGLTKASYTLLGSGNPVRMLAGVTTVETDGLSFESDDFRGATMGSAWTAASWVGTGILPSIFDGVYADATTNTPVGAVYHDISDLSVSKDYQIDLYIVPFNGQHNGTYQIYSRMNTAAPVGTTDGAIAELIINDATGTYSGSLKVYVASVLTNTYAFTGGSLSAATPGYFSVLISGNTLSCYWQGNLLKTQAISAPAGRRMGFGMDCSVASAVCLVSNWRVQYKTGTNKQVTRRRLIASSNGSVYTDGYFGQLTALGGSVNVANDRNLRGVERAQKLYVADNSTPRTGGAVVAVGTDGVIDVTGKQLTAASVADWTTLGIDVNNDVVIISNPLGGTIANTVPIASVIAGRVNLSYSVVQGTCSYRIERGVKVVDPVAGTVTLLVAKGVADGIAPPYGQVPSGCPLACLYRDRLVLAGSPVAPHAWFMSRQGDPTDWDYGFVSTDGGRAVAGQSALAGLISEPLTTLITHRDDYLIFGTANTMWILRGDPAMSGQIQNISQRIGVAGAFAWCRGPGGELIWLSRDGIYLLTADAGGVPVQISRDKLPQELIDIDAVNYSVSLEWDTRDIGVHIFITPNNSTARNHWWLDWTNKSFWPVTIPTTCDPFVTLAYAAQNNFDGSVILGGRDGYIRRFKDEAFTDDATAITSYVTFGPLKLGGGEFGVGLITEMQAMLAQNSGSVTWGVLTKPSNEPLFNQAMLVTGTFSRAGLNPRVRPRLRGGSALIKLSNAQTKPWSPESLVVVTEPLTTPRLST